VVLFPLVLVEWARIGCEPKQPRQRRGCPLGEGIISMSDLVRGLKPLLLSWIAMPFAVCCLTSLPAGSQATRPIGKPFVHPGLLHTRADLDLFSVPFVGMVACLPHASDQHFDSTLLLPS